MNMKKIIETLSEAKSATLDLRDEANHDEYAKYGELYEAILEAENVAKRNFEKRQKWEVRWIDAFADGEGGWTYNETRHVCEISIREEDGIEKLKEIMLAVLPDFVREDQGLKWIVDENADPVTVEIAVSDNDRPIYCATPIN